MNGKHKPYRYQEETIKCFSNKTIRIKKKETLSAHTISKKKTHMPICGGNEKNVLWREDGSGRGRGEVGERKELENTKIKMEKSPPHFL